MNIEYVQRYATMALADAARPRSKGIPQRPSNGANVTVEHADGDADAEGERDDDGNMERDPDRDEEDEVEEEISDAGSYDEDDDDPTRDMDIWTSPTANLVEHHFCSTCVWGSCSTLSIPQHGHLAHYYAV